MADREASVTLLPSAAGFGRRLDELVRAREDEDDEG